MDLHLHILDHLIIYIRYLAVIDYFIHYYQKANTIQNACPVHN